MRRTHRFFALILVVLGLSLLGCNKSGDPPKTTNTPEGSGSWADAPLALLDEQPITMNAVFATPEIRKQLIDLRNQDIEMQIIRYRFGKEGLAVDPVALTTFLDALYIKMGIVPAEGQTAAEAFSAKILEARGISQETWQHFAETQFMAEQLMMKQQPLTDAELQAAFDAVPKAQWFVRLAQQKGWTKEEDVTFEGAKDILFEEQKQQRIGELTTTWGQEARSKSLLTVNRLPSEPLPPDTPVAEGAVAPPIQQTAAITPEWRVDPVAYVLDGTEYTWDSIFDVELVKAEIERALWTPIEQAVLADVWKDSGMELSDADFASERTRVLAQMGGEAGLNDQLIRISASASELDDSIRRFVTTKRLLSKEYPVTDAEIEEAWNSIPPEHRTAMAQQELGMTPEAAANVTLAQASSSIRDMLEAERGGSNREEWLKGEIKKRLDDGRLVLKNPRLKAPEAAPETPMGGMPMGDAPPAIDLGEVAPPS